MKNFLVLAAVFGFILLAPALSTALPTHNNEVGLYTEPNGYGATGTFVMNGPVDVYLVLTRPTDVENGDEPYEFILAYELTLKFTPVPNDNLFLLQAVLPPLAVDIGLRKDINGGFLDYTVGIPSFSPLPVIDGAAVLVTFSFFNVNPGVTVVSLEPTTSTSTPGQMDYIGEINTDIRVMYSVGGSHEAGVFEFNGEAIAVESASFGSVKALYR